MPQNILTEVKNFATKLDKHMADILPNPAHMGKDARLAEAMKYSALSKGKRLRPFILTEVANIFGISCYSSLNVAVAMEFVHAFSLIHDDLPALDDDDIRRNQPSCHIAFDEATAILAGDALLALAFEILSHPGTSERASVRSELVLTLSKAVGFGGMIGGQMLDIISERQPITMEETTRLQRMKTGALFVAACEAGAILGGANAIQKNALRGYAHDIGLAFQISDDLLDAIHHLPRNDNDDESAHNDGENQLRQDNGKKTLNRVNKAEGKATYVVAMGIDKAKKQKDVLVNQAIDHLKIFGKKAENLREIARFISLRSS